MNYELIKKDNKEIVGKKYEFSLKEGEKKEVYSTKYERNPKIRKLAIQIHRTKCMICGFNFEKFYGIAERNFIEVHHIKPLAFIGEEIQINPETIVIVSFIENKIVYIVLMKFVI